MQSAQSAARQAIPQYQTQPLTSPRPPQPSNWLGTLGDTVLTTASYGLYGLVVTVLAIEKGIHSGISVVSSLKGEDHVEITRVLAAQAIAQLAAEEAATLAPAVAATQAAAEAATLAPAVAATQAAEEAATLASAVADTQDPAEADTQAAAEADTQAAAEFEAVHIQRSSRRVGRTAPKIRSVLKTIIYFPVRAFKAITHKVASLFSCSFPRSVRSR